MTQVSAPRLGGPSRAITSFCELAFFLLMMAYALVNILSVIET